MKVTINSYLLFRILNKPSIHLFCPGVNFKTATQLPPLHIFDINCQISSKIARKQKDLIQSRNFLLGHRMRAGSFMLATWPHGGFLFFVACSINWSRLRFSLIKGGNGKPPYHTIKILISFGFLEETFSNFLSWSSNEQHLKSVLDIKCGNENCIKI